LIEIPNLDSQTEQLKVHPGTQSGEVYRLKGRGVKDVHSLRRGDLFVKVLVKTPENLTKEEKSLLRRFAELRGEVLDKPDKSLAEKVKDIIH
jgi:molecular chaperone DnaJ